MAGHVENVRNYVIIWIWLMVLLIATVIAGAVIHREPWGILVAMTIAVIKAVLVILFFMHVKFSTRVTWVFASAAFLWLAIMISLTLADYVTRPAALGSQSQSLPAYH